MEFAESRMKTYNSSTTDEYATMANTNNVSSINLIPPEPPGSGILQAFSQVEQRDLSSCARFSHITFTFDFDKDSKKASAYLCLVSISSPPRLFNYLSKDCKPILTKSSKHSPTDNSLMQYEIDRINIPVKPLPVWLKNGKTVYIRQHAQQSNFSSQVVSVQVREANQSYSLVEDPDGQFRVVSNRDISKYKKFEDETVIYEKKMALLITTHMHMSFSTTDKTKIMNGKAR
ncbi:hypothetical protein GJ496_007178 [Pomphorhynchus laevis]|nr:hypothetical protein GJ496_007178 [Pomphorhynchus laevis]